MTKLLYPLDKLFVLLGFFLLFGSVKAIGTEDEQVFNRSSTSLAAGMQAFKLKVDAPVGTQLWVSAEARFIVDGKESSSVTVLKDGKIDVDIIIREDGQAIPIEGNAPTGNVPAIGEVAFALGDLDVQVITVDNISGVFETNPSQPVNMQARIFDAFGNELGNAQIQIQQTLPINSSAKFDLEPELLVFPNPAPAGVFNLQIKGAEINGLIAVHNALGALVAQLPPATFAEASEVKLDHLPKGVYYLKVPTKKGELIKKIQITQ
jgi:hypothetical protein